jgi:hypothetical protein
MANRGLFWRHWFRANRKRHDDRRRSAPTRPWWVQWSSRGRSMIRRCRRKSWTPALRLLKPDAGKRCAPQVNATIGTEPRCGCADWDRVLRGRAVRDRRADAGGEALRDQVWGVTKQINIACRLDDEALAAVRDTLDRLAHPPRARAGHHTTQGRTRDENRHHPRVLQHGATDRTGRRTMPCSIKDCDQRRAALIANAIVPEQTSALDVLRFRLRAARRAIANQGLTLDTRSWRNHNRAS